jgi:glycosyltransferase involved in cell wall biosynthesis
MKLGIISDCIHYQLPGGNVGTENHILLRQLEALCSHFSETLICCPFASFDDSKVVSTYKNSSIHFTPVPLVGGNNWGDKLKLFKTIPKWLAGYKKVDQFSDLVYQRFPNNLNIPGFVYFWIKNKNVFATYTGTWAGYAKEPVTYTLQRWILKRLFRGPVWVYTNSSIHDAKVHAGFSPSYSLHEWEQETNQVAKRIQSLETTGLSMLKMITVGSLIDYKNQLTILQACKQLKEKQIQFQLSVVGDGPMRSELEAFINNNNLQAEVKLLGKKNHLELRELYRQHDFVVQAPIHEGFGKVPIEAFFHGVIPIISNVGVAEMIVGENKRGFLFNPADVNQLVEILCGSRKDIELLREKIRKGRAYAQTQTLEAWAEEYYKTVTQYYSEA